MGNEKKLRLSRNYVKPGKNTCKALFRIDRQLNWKPNQ